MGGRLARIYLCHIGMHVNEMFQLEIVWAEEFRFHMGRNFWNGNLNWGKNRISYCFHIEQRAGFWILHSAPLSLSHPWGARSSGREDDSSIWKGGSFCVTGGEKHYCFRWKGRLDAECLIEKQGSLEAETCWRMITWTLKEVGRNVGFKEREERWNVRACEASFFYFLDVLFVMWLLDQILLDFGAVRKVS